MQWKAIKNTTILVLEDNFRDVREITLILFPTIYISLYMQLYLALRYVDLLDDTKRNLFKFCLPCT